MPGKRRATAEAKEQWIPVEEFAEFLGISVEEVMKRARQGHYRVQKFLAPEGGGALIPLGSFCGRKPPARAMRLVTAIRKAL